VITGLPHRHRPWLAALVGAAVAMVAGYVFVIANYLSVNPGLMIHPERWHQASLFSLPLMITGLFSWFFLPVGALVGALLPRLVRGQSLSGAIAMSLLVSLGIGMAWLVLGSTLSVVMHKGFTAIGSESAGLLLICWRLVAYSVPWVLVPAATRTMRGAT
jgi:hypothetical protein